jgi:hypothetical protein
MNKRTVASLIETSVPFETISTGWFMGRCMLCNDYKPRAGFKMEGGRIGFNCWNCGKTGMYEEFSGEMTRSFRNILIAHGVDSEEIDSTVNSAFFNEKEPSVISKQSLTKTAPAFAKPISLPKSFIQLDTNSDQLYQKKLIKYLTDRKVDVKKYPFYFSLEEKLLNRVIIPFYKNGKLIYWQARSIQPDVQPRYVNASVVRDSIMFNADELMKSSDVPLIVTEGVFDAMMVDGVALLGSKLNDTKLEMLRKSRRRLLFAIDKDKNGKKLADFCLEHGFEIVFVPDSATDLNNSVQRFGLSWSVYEMMKSIPKDKDAAQLQIKLNCR